MLNWTKTEIKSKQVPVMYKCRCRKVARRTFTVESYSECNNHPEGYLNKTWYYRRVNGGRWMQKTEYPSNQCECGATVFGKPVEARLTDHICDVRCTSATGHNCECSCGGQNHGIDHA